jgi:hypothetical protein
MTEDSDFQFTNATGRELTELLFRRAREREAQTSAAVPIQPLLGAALILVAEVLRGPVEASNDPRQTAQSLIEFSARWLDTLLSPATGGGQPRS